MNESTVPFTCYLDLKAQVQRLEALLAAEKKQNELLWAAIRLIQHAASTGWTAVDYATTQNTGESNEFLERQLEDIRYTMKDVDDILLPFGKKE